MSTQLHPAMAQALATFMPPPGFRAAPVMQTVGQMQARIDALSAALRKHNAPACPQNQIEYVHPHGFEGLDDELTCHFEYEPAEPENGAIGVFDLSACYLRGVDVAYRLTDAEVKQLNSLAWKHFQKRGRV